MADGTVELVMTKVVNADSKDDDGYDAEVCDFDFVCLCKQAFAPSQWFHLCSEVKHAFEPSKWFHVCSEVKACIRTIPMVPRLFRSPLVWSLS
jgi:hypothetical protein